MKNRFKITNNTVALLALLFIIVSSTSNYIIYNTGAPTGKYFIKGPQTGTMSLCLNHPPVINNNCTQYSYVLKEYYCFINSTDFEGRNMSYYDNSTLFDISGNGTIEFMPLEENIGYYKTLVNVSDNTPCSNSVVRTMIDLYVCMEPSWDNFKNSLTTNLSSLLCWEVVENFTIGIPNYALLNFTPGVLAMDGYDFDTHLNISHNYVEMNGSMLPSLNTSATITFYDLNFNTTVIIWNTRICDNVTCNIISYDGSDLVFNVSNLYGTYFVVDDVNLSLWDSTDNYTRYINEIVNFYANFTYKTGETVENEVCKAQFNIGGGYSEFNNMTYNSLSNLYEYNTTFNLSGIHNWKVLCNTSDLSANITTTFNISNREPIFYGPMPNETWAQDITLTGRDLDEYFVDPDNETLTFTYTAIEHITVQINPTTHIITLIPEIRWFGNQTIRYIGRDSGGLTAISNLILLNVLEVPVPVPVPSVSGGGGGAPPTCYEDWKCSVWGECLPSEIQTRLCIDKNKCGTTRNKPTEIRDCDYIPTCYDNIRNGDEEGVDCGGSCDVCPTCYDEIQNQEEEGVDCGGPCSRCPTCADGLRNGDEDGVDCGGSCPAICIPLFAPLTTGWRIFLLFLILIIVLIVIYSLLRKKIDSFYIKTKEKIILFLKKFKKEEEEVEYKSILEKVVEKLVDLENSIGKEKTKELFDDLLYILKGFFTDLLDIDYEFTYEELKKELKKQKINKKLIKGAVECYKEIENSRYTEEEQNEQKLRELINKAKVVVRNLVLLKTLIEEEENISTLIKRGEEFVRKKDKLNSKIFYMKTLQVYKSLDETEKSKHYNKIKNLHTLISDMKEDDDTGKKMLSIILVFASVFFLSFFIGPQKTGFVVFENQPLQMENISTQYAVVGERYYSELNIYGGMGKITFFDDTELFEVSNEGVIDFIPKEEQRGLHKIVVIVEDEEMSRDHKLIKFRIE